MKEVDHRVELGCDVTHYLLDDLYAKQISIKAGDEFPQHIHPYDHLSILAAGRVELYVSGVMQVLDAPACIEIKAEVHHRVVAVTDVLWYCIHAIRENV